ncbi:galactose-1-phosphate uridylyltransferase [Mycetocola tolaasinivorans]|uniref:Galactose-1-phosphate uridylyltransferase n=1 Tax=Mycetocola tolaasinivorans TaxID=76635 RepID=A0A3L7A6V7_9MICO|nr:galactose-1-phosphate uridylyltransferase [Mycetocola tolaasinivorans]RLP75618.1 galactose-1-phosphate uridylyltransferase [Mycetocola tolaasinivorans]
MTTHGVTYRTHLADGRELLYFTDFGTVQETPPADSRDLPPRPGAEQGGATMRFDPLRGDWIAFAAHRQGRIYLPPTDLCPICASRPGHATEIPAAEYDVVAFENRFPSFGPEPAVVDLTPALGAVRPAAGRCEVVVFGSDHDASLSQMPPQRMRTIVGAWAQRTAELRATEGVEQVFAFENRGAQIGVTLHHPHGQIYAYPFVTPTTRLLLGQAAAHRERTGANLFADILAFEHHAGERVIERGEHFTAFVPFAARMPIEVHLYPHRHVGNLDELTEGERDELADMYLRLLRGIDGLYDDPTPYISAWFQAPSTHPDRGEMRLHLQITSPRRAVDKLKYLAGSEAAMGAFIGDVIPEETAARLRATPAYAGTASGIDTTTDSEGEPA